MSSLLTRFTLFLLLAVAAGCASDQAARKTAEDYMKAADELSAKGRYDEAIAQWKKVKESYRSPEVSALAELKIADAFYAKEAWIEAAAAYEDFRKLHPGNDKAPYALYRMALSHYNQIEKIDTDQTPVRNAVTTLEMFLKQYPQSEYAKDAADRFAACRYKMAQYELYVGRFYYRTDKYISAVGRLEGVLRAFPDTPAVEETLYYLGASYLQIGELAKGKELLNRLVREFPAGGFAEKARKLVASS